MNMGFRRPAVAGVLVAAAVVVAVAGDDENNKLNSKEKTAKSSRERPAIEVRFVDDSTLKVALQEGRLELVTAYGKLLIPVGDIHRIDFGWHISPEVQKKIETLIDDLGSKEFRKREAACTELLELRDKAYRHLLRAEKDKDPEVARRAEGLLNQIRDTTPADRLDTPSHDVVYTEDSKITGHLTATVLKVTTFQFGEQQLKLADLRGLRSLAGGSESGKALPDPGQLSALGNQIGKTYSFQVTGVARLNFGGGGLWGSDVYTVDSPLALASVHAGILRPGQTGVVSVTILGPQASFHGSTQNGITSMSYGAYSGYRINKREKEDR
jgi:hypothetical protein